VSHPEHEKNRAVWNEIVGIHVNHPDYRTDHVINGGSSLKKLELGELGDVRGKKLLHLMCQFGLDTLSWARQGAIVTGADISDRSIEEANKLTARTGLDARFVRSDVLDLIGKIDDRFDIVYQSYGTLAWLGDLKRWAEVVAHYLKSGGTFLLIDGHPIRWIIAEPNVSYFADKPEYYENEPDYCDRSYRRKNVSVEWIHSISEILNSLIRAGLTIEKLEEFDYGYYGEEEGWYQVDGRWYPPTGPSKYPLMLLVRATKP
jgi:SAM-dependent methyltransferase